ncbi:MULTISPECIES: YolD-like family protein [unclassified Staphylococcus]|uniref:YolD-like family protein n=1 Tax=unclassified Staphylococcus TaxID=91994 RepID=UPI001AEBD204|nr:MULTISPECIES: YolD-like family protein [unclassified Staphylococcus]
MMPDKYKFETDYRKIPREYLNPRIPQGRGMVKWQPFKTMPEQYERLEQYVEDQNKIDKPLLSDDQLYELNETLMFKMLNDPEVIISYYESGYIKKIEGYIRKVDDYEQMLYLYEGNGLSRISLKDIVEIK